MIAAAAAESIVMNKDANFLCKNGGIKLTKEWTKSFKVCHFEEMKSIFDGYAKISIWMKSSLNWS